MEINISERSNLSFKGKIEFYERDCEGEFTIKTGETKNLWVDDGKELVLDWLFGLDNWLSPDWYLVRWCGKGTCMFNNSSFERASGMDYIPTGTECSYPVSETWLVSPEDSFLSREVGIRNAIQATRRDQTVEMKIQIDVPGDVPFNTKIREWGIFLKAAGPYHDPSLHAGSKMYSMICRAAMFGTGWYNDSGATCVPCGSGDLGATLCYYDEPYIATGDFQARWRFGEL